MMVILGIQMITFIIQIFCFIPIISDKAKRQYGRWFGTRIDSDIWLVISTLMCCIILSLTLIIHLGR